MTAPFEHEEEVRQRPYDPRLMGRLLACLRPYRARVGFLIAVTLILALAHLVVPHILQEAIDGPILARHPRGIVPYAAAYLAAVGGVALLQAAQGYATVGLGLRVTRDLRLRIYEHLHSLSLPYYDRHPVGRLYTRVMGDVDALNELLSSGIVTAASDAFLLGGVVAVMLTKHAALGTVALSALVLLVPVALAYRRVAQRMYRQIRLRISRLNIATQENIAGMRVVQMFNRQGENYAFFDAINRDHTAWWERALRRHAAFSCSIQVLQVLASALIIAYGGTRLLAGDPTVTIGLLVAFLRYAQLFFRPVLDLTEKYNILLAAMASSERIFELLDTRERIEEPAVPLPLGRSRGEVVFEDVHLAYRAGEDVLRGVSFRAASGERIALVGPTGAGKTSVLAALGRFYPIRAGRILLDGVPTDAFALDALRRQMAVVPQEPFLFSGTILENLRLGREEIPREKVEEACRAVQIHDFIERRGGYDAPVRERGAGFSEGERQLLSFARALVFDPPILVLDEATANVDPATEARLQEAMRVLLRGRTSFVVAHRLATVREADRILVFDRGALVEQGSHADLLARGGLYARLHALQFREGRAA